MEIRGKIIQVLPLQQGTSQRGTAWKKQEYVLETYDQFPRKVKFDFFGDKADQYPLQLGEDVVLSFDLESRSFIGRDGIERWSTDVRGWKAEKFDPTMGAPAAAPQFAAQPAAAAPQFVQPAPVPMGAAPVDPGMAPQPSGDDLPF